MTIQNYYDTRINNISYKSSTIDIGQPIHYIEDFYNLFLCKAARIPDIKILKEWNELLIWYVDQPNAVFFVRKYESAGKKGAWDNRRGATTKFKDNFEIVYASNFLAHDFYLMAYNNFVPSKNDFMDMILNRKLKITSGTKVEKAIRLYPSSNRTLKCYLAHVMDVNGQYLRNNGKYEKISRSEAKKMYPLGTMSDWTTNPDRIHYLDYSLSAEEKSLIKAHTLRFLSPINYFVTPQTNHCVHSIAGLTKNIGEYQHLTFDIQNKFMSLYDSLPGGKYSDFIKLCRYKLITPANYDPKEPINLTYDNNLSVKAPVKPQSKPNTSYKAKYVFNLNHYNSLRRLALAIVEQFVVDNPQTTYNGLTQTFNLQLSFNNKPLIRLRSDLTQEEIYRKRAFIDHEIKLIDNNIVVVNNQFQEKDRDHFLDLVNNIGYTVIQL